MTLEALMEAIDREYTVAAHYHKHSQIWALATSLSKIHDLSRKAEQACNQIIFDEPGESLTIESQR